VLIRAPDQEGDYQILDEETPGDTSIKSLNKEARKRLGTLRVKGVRRQMALPIQAELAPLAPYKHIEDKEITGQQEVHFGTIATKPGTYPFALNGAAFDASAPPRKLKLGGVDEWTVTRGRRPARMSTPSWCRSAAFSSSRSAGLRKTERRIPRSRRSRRSIVRLRFDGRGGNVNRSTEDEELAKARDDARADRSGRAHARGHRRHARAADRGGRPGGVMIASGRRITAPARRGRASDRRRVPR
jgi:hypothetical protein